MAVSSVPIIRNGFSMEYLGNAFRDGIILVVINLKPKQVDTENPSQWKDMFLCNSNKSEDENHFLLDCKAYSKISDAFFSRTERKLPNFKWLFDTIL